MISFKPTEEEAAFVDVARQFAKGEIRPQARECEENRQVNAGIADKSAELGLNALELPESWGGLGLPLVPQVQLWQALASGDLGVAQGLPGAGDAASLIRLAEEHPALVPYKEAGRDGFWPTAAVIDVTDPDAPWASQLKVRRDGAGFVLEGVSQPVRLAAFADYLAVAAVDTAAEPVLLWLSKKDTDGWKTPAGDVRLGLLAAGIARVQFDQTKVTGEHIVALGEEARDLAARMRARIRVLQAAKGVGLMEAALAYVTEYTAERKAFGQVIAKFQGVSFRVAEMAIETRLARNLVWEAAAATDTDSADAAGSVLRALYRSHRSLRYVTDSAVQLLGGHGFVQEFPAEKWMRDAQAHVGLYGRERDLLLRRGEQIVNAKRERAAQ